MAVQNTPLSPTLVGYLMKLPFEGLLKFNNIDMERFGFNSLVPRPGLLTDRPDFIKVELSNLLERNWSTPGSKWKTLDISQRGIFQSSLIDL